MGNQLPCANFGAIYMSEGPKCNTFVVTCPFKASSLGQKILCHWEYFVTGLFTLIKLCISSNYFLKYLFPVKVFFYVLPTITKKKQRKIKENDFLKCICQHSTFLSPCNLTCTYIKHTWHDIFYPFKASTSRTS
jgi:hypothetical protein